ncbi:MAG: hypothetical protein EVA71_08415, partial [Limisphaerales bacterium]
MEFLDGSYLHGDVEQLSAENGLDWQHPLAANPMRFNLDNLSRLRLNASNSIASEVQPECRFEFVNGDLIYGNLQRLSREE